MDRRGGGACFLVGMWVARNLLKRGCGDANLASAIEHPNHQETIVKRLLPLALIFSAGAMVLATSSVFAHGDVTPQAVDVHTLAPLGAELRGKNPYRDDKEAIRIGSSAFNQNCARCHGLEAISGGIAPDLRKLDIEPDTDVYYLESVMGGKVRNGAVYMPPFKDTLSQEAMWAIKAYLETRRASFEQ